MIRPQSFIAQVTAKEQLTSKVLRLILQCQSPSEIVFLPGQFINLKCSATDYRAYSIASAANNGNFVELLIEVAHDGIGSNYVRSLNVGNNVSFIGPSGKLHLYEPLDSDLVFIATGTGLAPFLSMFCRLEELKYQRAVRLLVGFRTVSDILEQSKLDYFRENLHDFDYQLAISRPDTGLKAYVTDLLPKHYSYTARYFVCGHPDMVASVESILLKNLIEPKNIILEGFTHKAQS